MIIKAIRLIALCASMFGYMRFISRRIAPELSIGFTFTAIGSVMLAAGLLNALPETAILVCLGGLACLAWTFFKEKRKLTLSLGGTFFLVMCAVLAARVWGQKINAYDSFSHWGLVVKHMLAKDRFPNFMDDYVHFQSYPLGAGALIYYCAKVSGIHSEWFQMLAHWACAAGLLSGLFCLARRLPAKLACFASAVLLLCSNNNFDMLQVDSALAFVALGAVAFCVFYRNDLRRMGFYVLPWLTFLITVKNSGALFVLYEAFLVFLWGGWRKGIASLAAPFGLLLIWNRHVAYVFESGLLSQHAMSIDHFRRMLDAKRARSVQTILSKMAQKVFMPDNPYLAIFAVSAAVFVLALLLLKKARAERTLAVYGVVCYLLYQAGLTGMYIFSMSEKEAVVLATYSRYNGTILIFCAGVMLMAILLMSGDMCEIRNGGRRSAALCAACVLAIVLSGMPNYGHYLRRHDADAATRASYRQTMEELLDGYGVPAESSYYVLVDEDFPHTSLLSYMTSYLTLSDAVEIRKPGQIQGDAEILKSDYLLAFGDSPEVMDAVERVTGRRERVVSLAEVEPSAERAEPEAPLNLAELMKRS